MDIFTKTYLSIINEEQQKTQWYCDTCDQYFRTRKELIDHRKVHPHKCKYCGQNFETGIKLSNHQKYCKLNPNAQQNKKKQASSLRNYYLNLPQDSRWRNADRYISKPCQQLKQYLRDNGINFYQEYFNPEQFEGHLYSIDIAFPNQKIAIEVNGNHHYNSDKTLKPQYQYRHEVLERAGWTVYEVFYKNTYQQQFREDLVKLIKQKVDFTYDYSKELNHNREKKIYYCPVCGKPKTKVGKLCKECERQKRKQDIPSKQQLLKDIQQLGNMTAIGRKYNKSDNAVKKWCEKYDIPYHIKDIRKDLLYQYQGEKYLLSQLAQKFNINVETLRDRLKRMPLQEALKYKKPDCLHLTKQQLQQDLNSGLTKSDIARKYNLNFSSMRRWFLKFNL